ncbi:MAG: hypothetical protein ACKVHP_22410, partial [Verrucomicrobiales bacterium]
MARTRTNWKFEKEILMASKIALDEEVKQIQAQIEDSKKEEETADESSRKLAKEQVELANAAETVTSVISKLEDRLVALVPQLPPYL